MLPQPEEEASRNADTVFQIPSLRRAHTPKPSSAFHSTPPFFAAFLIHVVDRVSSIPRTKRRLGAQCCLQAAPPLLHGQVNKSRDNPPPSNPHKCCFKYNSRAISKTRGQRSITVHPQTLRARGKKSLSHSGSDQTQLVKVDEASGNRCVDRTEASSIVRVLVAGPRAVEERAESCERWDVSKTWFGGER